MHTSTGYYDLNGICMNKTDCGAHKFPNLVSARCDECDALCSTCSACSTSDHCTV